MAAQVFAFIVHKNGVADDTALELVSAARNIYPDASLTAIATGAGADLDAVCNDLVPSFGEVWKFDTDALAYPNAEAIRKLLMAVLPADAIVLFPHDTFGMDLAPGLAVKMDSVFVSDVAGFEGMDGNTLKVIRQEYSGQVSTHLMADISAGAVINVRPGVFQPDESRSAGGQVVDKSSQIGDLSVGRRLSLIHI